MDASYDNRQEVSEDREDHVGDEKSSEETKPRDNDRTNVPEEDGSTDPNSDGRFSSGSEDLSFEERVNKAAKRYLKYNDYKIIEEGTAFDFIVKDKYNENCIRFINVTGYRNPSNFKNEYVQRVENKSSFETKVIKWLEKNIENIPDNYFIVYDEIDILAFNENKALLRHNRNAFMKDANN